MDDPPRKCGKRIDSDLLRKVSQRYQPESLVIVSLDSVLKGRLKATEKLFQESSQESFRLQKKLTQVCLQILQHEDASQDPTATPSLHRNLIFEKLQTWKEGWIKLIKIFKKQYLLLRHLGLSTDDLSLFKQRLTEFKKYLAKVPGLVNTFTQERLKDLNEIGKGLPGVRFTFFNYLFSYFVRPTFFLRWWVILQNYKWKTARKQLKKLRQF